MDRAISIKTRAFEPQDGGAISPAVSGFRSHRSRAFFVRLADGLKDFFNHFFGGQLSEPLGDFHIQVHEGAMTIRVEIPGFEAEDLDVNVQRNLLIVRAFKPIEANGKKRESADLGFQELYDCAFLPSSVDAAKVEADYCDGVLTVTLPKMETRKVGRALAEDNRISHPAPAAEVARSAQRWSRSDLTQWPLRAFERAARPLNTKHAGNVRRCG
jgi:HSP20 family protein